MQNHEPSSVEIFADEVEEAIQQGLAQLALTREEVKIEVLDEGSRGFLGLGARQAHVRLSPTQQQEPTTPAGDSVPPITPPLEVSAVPPEPAPEEPAPPSEPAINDEETRILETGRAIVEDLLERMHIQAQVNAQIKPPETAGRHPTLWVDINGKDLSILIGRRGETLEALQYITSLILGKELEQFVPLVIDVEGYRQRRITQLQRLAKRLAEQVVDTGRRQALEPMPASERRVIHLALRNHPDVITESVGEEPHRKVTIIPKEH